MPLFDESGKVVGTTGIAQDISERKRYEEDLVRAREAADCANHAKSAFLANMSHEIRTPMNGIIGMNQLLLDHRLDGNQRRYAEVVRDSANSLLAILDDILDFSKIEAGKLELETVDFDVRAIVEGVADLMAAKAQEKGLELLCLIQPEIPSGLRGDPVRLRQVILNLLGNAVKFTEAGEVTLQVRLEAAGSTVTLRFEVTDTGVGVPEDKQSLLFQPFSQVDTSTTRRQSGTGLGLSIVHKLVELMGGQVGFESRTGQGTRVWFTASFQRVSGGGFSQLALAGGNPRAGSGR